MVVDVASAVAGQYAIMDSDNTLSDPLKKTNRQNVNISMEGKNVITSYALSQNYPNPFNPSTTISYDLPKAGTNTLKVYNTLGQEVATLVNTTQEPGRYSVTFDASKLSSGMYIYKLTSGSFSQTKRMMLVK